MKPDKLLCNSCPHEEVCKFEEEYKKQFNKAKEEDDENNPFKTTIECKYYGILSNAITNTIARPGIK